MPYLYEDTVRGDPKNALTIPSSREDVLTETFASAFEENPILASKRWLDLREDQRTGPKLDAATARIRLKEAGMEKDLQVSDAGITEAALETLMERKRIEKRRQETFARAEGGVGEFAQRLGIGFATTLVDPLSAGLNFVPVVGQARYARWLAGAGSMAGRAGVRAGVGAAEGLAGAAITEPLIYAMRTQEQADYDAVDSLMNVTFGGVIGAGLHTTVGTLGELIARQLPKREATSVTPRVEPALETVPARTSEPLPADVQRLLLSEEEAAKLVNRLPPEAQQATLRAAVGQAVEGRAIDVEPIIQTARQNAASNLAASANRVVNVLPEEATTIGGAHPEWPKVQQIFDDALNEGRFVTHHTEMGPIRLVNAQEASGGKVMAYNSSGEKIGQLDYSKVEMPDGRRWNPEIEVDEKYRRQGIASAMYDVAEATGGKIPRVDQPGQLRSLEGQAFREGREGKRLAAESQQELAAAQKSADETLAREIEPTIDANLKAAEEEASLAEADAKALLERLGLKLDDPDTTELSEAIEKAERWAKAAELATVCLVRGG